MLCYFFFFKQKTAYEMRISDWSSDVCSSDLKERDQFRHPAETIRFFRIEPGMSVADYAPGTWYAKILLPYLGAQGSYVGMTRTIAASDRKSTRLNSSH